ncbi:MAG: hypothetical protein KBF69_05150, partial [Saprospiraceae bacterium]|nr:hypothetical protein [Saprospiraceae bacterium]
MKSNSVFTVSAWTILTCLLTVGIFYKTDFLSFSKKTTKTNSELLPPTCIISGPDFVCNNSTGNIYKAPPGMISYSWSIMGDGVIVGSTTDSFIIVTSGSFINNYTVSVTITDFTGPSMCSKTTNIYLFTPNDTITANPNPVCFGVTVSLSIPSASSSTVTWTGNGITIPNGTFISNGIGGFNNVTTASPSTPGKHIYSVSITTEYGCTYSDSVNVNVDTASIVDAGPDQTICANDTIQFCAVLSGVATNLVWQKNVAFGTFIGADTDPKARFVLNANGKSQTSIKFGVMSNDPSANVCQGGVDTVEIFIDPAAVVDAGPGQRICGSVDTVALDGSYSAPTAGIVWSTTGSGSFVPNVNDTNARYVLSENDRVSDSIKIYITSVNDPAGLCGIGKDSMTLIIDSASIVDAGPDQTICANDTIQFCAVLSGVATNLVWQKNVAFGTFIGADTDPKARFVLNANGKSQTSIKFGVMSNDPSANVCQGGVDTVEIFIVPEISFICRDQYDTCYVNLTQPFEGIEFTGVNMNDVTFEDDTIFNVTVGTDRYKNIITRIFTASNACDTSSCTQYIYLVDNPPSMIVYDQYIDCLNEFPLFGTGVIVKNDCNDSASLRAEFVDTTYVPAGFEINGITYHTLILLKYTATDSCGQEGSATQFIYSRYGKPGFNPELQMSLSDDTVCINDDSYLYFKFGNELIGCDYLLNIQGPNNTATFLEKISKTNDSISLQELFQNASIPWEDTSYSIELIPYCGTDTLCPILLDLELLSNPDLQVSLDKNLICENQNSNLIITVNGKDGDSCLLDIWYNSGKDSGWAIVDEKYFVNFTYTFDVAGLIPGPGLPIGNYTFKVFVDCDGRCPSATKSVILAVTDISKLYVDSSATGNNTGLSWTDAFTSLQDALLFADCRFDTICVAQGTYYPDTAFYHTLTNNDRNLSFNIPDSTVVLGGFPSGGGNISDRNWVCNKTILCGDIDQSGTL